MSEQKLYIGNLPYRATEGDVREYLSNYGPVYSVILVYNSETGWTRGYGFVELEDSAAEAVLRDLNDTKFMGRNLKIHRATGKGALINDNKNPQQMDAANLTAPPPKTIAERFGRGNAAIRDMAGESLSGNFGDYGYFKREEFNGLHINDKYYDTGGSDYGLYHSYKFAGSKMKYSGPSNISPMAEI
jgi:RNA recognition motif-containing protein